jgi:cell fate regulator YaaT (PSP1 superfamily)
MPFLRLFGGRHLNNQENPKEPLAPLVPDNDVSPSAVPEPAPAIEPQASAPAVDPTGDSPPPAAEAPAAPADTVSADQLLAAEAAPPPPTEYSAAGRQTIIVRYGAMGLTGRFVHSMAQWRCGERVVIKSDRGQEIGVVVCAWGGCAAPGGVSPQVRGEVLRPATHADEVEARHLVESERREFTYAKQCIAARALPMKMVAVEHLFGGDRIVFYFVSESRVDFRALVRDLAHEFQTRIEMRQIGVRDEARLLGDFERCGRPLCCRAWIKELEPVSMKMAKVQKATLDPTKISGRCGRLMCCLRFEHATYRELSANLPRKNTMIMTPEGPGKVIDADVMSQVVSVLLMTGTRTNVPLELITAAGTAPAKPAAKESENKDALPETESRLADALPTAPRAEAPAAQPQAVQPEAPTEQPPAAPPAPQPPRPQGQQGQPGQQGQGQQGQPGQPGQPNRGRRGRRRSRRGGRNRGRSQGGGPAQAGGPPPQAASQPPSTGSPPVGN